MINFCFVFFFCFVGVSDDEFKDMPKLVHRDTLPRLGPKKYATRLTNKQNEALTDAMKHIDTIDEREQELKDAFDFEMAKLRENLCVKLKELVLEKGAVQDAAADIVSAVAIKSVKSLGSTRMKGKVSKKTKKPKKPQTRRAKTNYTQQHLTTALVHIVKSHYSAEKTCSIRKAAKLYMDNKYGVLNRVWNQHHCAEVLDLVKEDEAVLYVSQIQKPKVCLFVCCLSAACLMFFHLFVCSFFYWLFVSPSPPHQQIGNPLWVNHVNPFHELLMVSMIKYMAVSFVLLL